MRKFLAFLVGALLAVPVTFAQTTSTDRLQGLSASVAVKGPVKAVSTANLTLEGAQTVNSVAVVDGDRVLVKNQTNATENGIYVVSTSAWARAADFDGARDAVDGTLVVSNNDTSIFYRVTTNNPITIGTSSIAFELVSGAVSQSSIGGVLYPQTPAELAAGVTPTFIHIEPLNVKRYGALGNDSANDYAAIASAISVASQTVSGAIGANVYFPTGTYQIGSMITLPNRVRLHGPIGRGAVIKPHSSFAASYMFNAVNGTSSMFGSRLDDLYIDARGKNMTAVIFAQAWQDTSGMSRTVVQYDGTTPSALLISNGYGGAQYLKLEDVEIFADSTAVNDIGIDVQQISAVGAFKVHLIGVTINGTVTNVLSKCIRLINDSLIVDGFHTEYSAIGVYAGGVGSISVNTMTGSFNSTGTLITLDAAFTGIVNARTLIPNGATGPTIDNNVTGRDVRSDDGRIVDYVYPVSTFSAHVTADINNVTGNGTTYTVLFGTEHYDEKAEHAVGTGIFTPQRAGRYLLSAYLKLDVPVGSTIASMQILTTGRTFVVWRGDPEAIRDSGTDVTIGGSVLASMEEADTARVTITVSGIGADTVDVLMDESVFEGHWLSR